MKRKLKLRLFTVFAAIATMAALAPAGTANAAKSCHYAAATGKFGCNGSDGVRRSSDVIGARIFTGTNYTGEMLTIWVPEPCPKNGEVDWELRHGSARKNNVGSVQPWSTCWVWLYDKNENPSGPFKSNNGDVTQAGGNSAVHLGLS